MMDFFKTLFSADGFMPHGHCYLWRPGVLWLHITSDALIALAYYSIPFTLVYFIRKRQDVPFNWMFLCFATFIIACGTTHLMEIWVIWHPTYWLSGSIKALTALVSVPTAILLMRLLPQALALPSPAVLRAANAELAREIVERKRAEDDTRRLNDELERRVAERTQQLEKANEILTQEIRERKRAVSGQERLAAIVNSSDDAIVGKTLAGIITDWNPGAERLFGYTAAEAIGRPMRFIYPLERVAEETEILARIARGESVKNYETVRIRKDGQNVDVSVTVSPILDHKGTIVGASKVARDITERKREAEKTKWLASFPERNPIPIVEIEYATGTVRYQNSAAVRLFPELSELRLEHPYLGGIHAATVALQKGGRRLMQRELEVAGRHYTQTISYGLEDRWLRIYGLEITARKQAEEILRESEERYRTLFNTLIEGFCTIEVIFDASGKPLDFRFLEVNPAFERQTGLHNAQGKLISELAPDIEPYWLETYGKIALTGEPMHLENEAKPLGRFYDVYAYRVGAAENRKVAILFNDITDRKRMENALQESEKRFRTMANSISQLAWIARADGFITWYNERWYAYTGTKPGQMEGWDWQGVHDPQRLPEVIARWGDTIALGQPFEMEFPLRGADGQFRRFLTRALPIKNAEGKVEQWFGTNTDVDELKRAEEQLKASLKEVNDLKMALDEHAIVAITDPQGKITYVNDKFCTISKYSRSELLGQDHRLINSRFHPKEFIRDLWTTIAQGKVWHGEIKNKAKDGSYYWVDTTIMPFLDENGKPRQYVAIRADITERKRVEAEILRLNTELERRVAQRTSELESANKELEAFSYSISHDLRAPLRAINGFAGIVLEEFGPQLPAEGQRYLERVRNGGKRMGELIDDLLSFSRLSRLPLSRQAVDMTRLVQEALAELAPAGNDRQTEMQIGELPPCLGDPALLKQVWINLLSNALKYSRSRTPAIIQVGCKQADGKNVYFVSDNGVGFEMQYAKKLFGVFQRLHRTDEFEGTGVGLAIVHRIVNRHGGRIWAEAELDRGAAFYFFLEGENT